MSFFCLKDFHAKIKVQLQLLVALFPDDFRQFLDDLNDPETKVYQKYANSMTKLVSHNKSIFLSVNHTIFTLTGTIGIVSF